MTTDPVRPEVHAALALAERHQRAAETSECRWPPWRSRRLVDKHRSKAQKHLSRAARYAAQQGG